MKPLPFLRRLLPSLLLTGLLATAAHGDPIVHWGGNYVSSYTALEAGTPSTGAGTSLWRYSDTVAKSPTYSGPKFYGAFSLEYSGGTGTPVFRDDFFGITSGAANLLRFSAAPLAGETILMRGAVFFKKEDFLTGSPTGKVTFDNTSTITFAIGTTGTSIGATRQVSALVYALVGTEWGWYISEAAKNGSFDITDAAAQKWASFTLDESGLTVLNGRPSSSNFTVLGSAFDDIGAIGFYFNYESKPDNWTSLYITSFDVNAHVEAIPEPATTAFFFFGGATAMLLGARAKVTR